MAKQNLVYQFVFVLTGIEVKFLLSGFWTSGISSVDTKLTLNWIGTIAGIKIELYNTEIMVTNLPNILYVLIFTLG